MAAAEVRVGQQGLADDRRRENAGAADSVAGELVLADAGDKLEAVVIRISGPAEHTVVRFAVFFVGAVQKHALRTKSVGGRQGDLFHSKYPLSMRNFVVLLKSEYHFLVVLSRTAYRRRQKREPRLAQTAVRASGRLFVAKR